MNEKDLICPICETSFKKYPEIRKDSIGRFWCKKCQDEHDKIDWEEVYK